MPFALLDHDDTGAGRAVCLLHSGVTDRRMWAGVRAALPDGLRVVAPDLRGFGGTSMPAPDISYTDASDVAAVLDAAGISGATVVGSSLGGRVAQELAVTRPDLVSSLVLLCAALPALVVIGEQDFDYFIAVGEHLAAAIPRARLVRLPWAGHLPALEQPPRPPPS